MPVVISMLRGYAPYNIRVIRTTPMVGYPRLVENLGVRPLHGLRDSRLAWSGCAPSFSSSCCSSAMRSSVARRISSLECLECLEWIGWVNLKLYHSSSMVRRESLESGWIWWWICRKETRSQVRCVMQRLRFPKLKPLRHHFKNRTQDLALGWGSQMWAITGADCCYCGGEHYEVCDSWKNDDGK